MKIQEFSTPAHDGIRIKHNAQIRFTVKAGREVLEDRLISPDTINGAITVAGIMYNRLAMSGGISWWNPATGKSISRPKMNFRVRSEDILIDDAICNCPNCG